MTKTRKVSLSLNVVFINSPDGFGEKAARVEPGAKVSAYFSALLHMTYKEKQKNMNYLLLN
jgi:hypothetical protein